MELKTYRAATMHDALAMVRHDLGPDAAVLHTREVQSRRFFGWLSGPREIEVTASRGVNVPSRLPGRGAYEEDRDRDGDRLLRLDGVHSPDGISAKPQADVNDAMQSQLSELQQMVQELCRRSDAPSRELPEELFQLFTDLLDSDLNEELARELVEQVRTETRGSQISDLLMVKARLARMIEAEVRVSGPIQTGAPSGSGRSRLVALVGPTGVGKTTTIAKLAANYRLKEKRRVGLITVDTYRIAAVEQLRTYADIIDLPMQVVSTPREMREAVGRMDDLDLILLDTAGRSPKDEVRIQELRAFLSEADADEVHLVLSSVASGRVLEQTAERFAAVGTTALILTKLDECSGLGNVLPLIRSSKLPLSYLTNGQNVPDDIEVAESMRVARLILGMQDN
jgi:flagellar biosynthesis protein FlhF